MCRLIRVLEVDLRGSCLSSSSIYLMHLELTQKPRHRAVFLVGRAILTKWMIPAAVSHVETNMALICASRMEVEVLRMLRYCRMSGRVMRRRARRKRRPAMINGAHCAR